MELEAAWSPMAAATAASMLPSPPTADADQWRTNAARRARIRHEAQAARQQMQLQLQQQSQAQAQEDAPLSISGAQVGATAVSSSSSRSRAAAAVNPATTAAGAASAAAPAPRPSPPPLPFPHSAGRAHTSSAAFATAASPFPSSARFTPSRGAHRRHPSSLGSSPLAREEEEGGTGGHAYPGSAAAAAAAAAAARTPLDECPPLFAPGALGDMLQLQPYLQDVAELATTLQHITQESGVELDRGNPSASSYAAGAVAAAGGGADEVASVIVPSVSVGWSGNRRQQVSEIMLHLQNCVERLLVEPPALADSFPAGSGERRRLSGPDSLLPPVPSLRSEFLGSRELLSLVDACGSSPASLAPSLLALAKSYQNRLLELQVADQVRLEIDPPSMPEPLPMSKRQMSQRKQSVISTAAAAAKAKQGQQQSAAGAAATAAAPTAHPPPRHARKRSSFSSRRPSIVPSAASIAAALVPSSSSSRPSSASASSSSPFAPSFVAPPRSQSKWLRLENQGALEAYLPWNLVKREMHLFDAEIVDLTKLYWRACFVDQWGKVHTGVTPATTAAAAATPASRRLHERNSSDAADTGGGGHGEGGGGGMGRWSSSPDSSSGGLLVGLPRRLYMHLFTLVHFVLKPSYLPSYAQAVVAADWLTDVHLESRPRDAARALMTLPQFHIALFALVDTWTEGVGRDEYVQFLRNLFVFITEEVPGAGGGGGGSADPAPGSGALPPVGNVFRRWLKPLTIGHINNLRRLGLRARTSFSELTPQMLEEIEERSRVAANAAAARLAAQRGETSPAMSRVSSTASILSNLARAREGEEPEEYHPHMHLRRRLELSSLIHRPGSASGSGGSRPVSASGQSGSSAPGHRRRPSKGMGSLLRASRAEAAKAAAGEGAGTGSPSGSPESSGGGGGTAARHKRSPSREREANAFPSWVTLSEFKSPRTRSKTSSSSSSPTTGGGEGGSGARRTPRFPNAIIPSSTPSSVREEEEGQEDGDEGEDGDGDSESSGDEDRDDEASMRRVLEEASSTPIESLRDAVSAAVVAGSKRSRRAGKGSGGGALSWRRPSTAGAADENERAMAEVFVAMKAEFDEIKRARRREREEAATRTRQRPIREEEVGDEGEEQEEEERRAARRAKRAARKNKASKDGPGPIVEEKENDTEVYSPFQRTRGVAATAAAAEGQGPAVLVRRGSATANANGGGGSGGSAGQASKRKQRRPASAGVGFRAGTGAGASVLPRPHPPDSFEQQRLAFQAESADYLARMARLQQEARMGARGLRQVEAQPSALPLASTPAMPQQAQAEAQTEAQVQDPSLPPVLPLVEESPDGLLLKQLIQHQLVQAAPPSSSSMSRQVAAPLPLADVWGSPAQQVAQLEDLARRTPAALQATTPAPPFSVLLSARAPVPPSGDARDRFWKLMPQGRVRDVRDGAHHAGAQTARAPTSTEDRICPRYCECYWCTEHLSSSRVTTASISGSDNSSTGSGNKSGSGDGAHLTARSVHRLMAREIAAPSKGLDRIQRVLQCI